VTRHAGAGHRRGLEAVFHLDVVTRAAVGGLREGFEVRPVTRGALLGVHLDAGLPLNRLAVAVETAPFLEALARLRGEGVAGEAAHLLLRVQRVMLLALRLVAGRAERWPGVREPAVIQRMTAGAPQLLFAFEREVRDVARRVPRELVAPGNVHRLFSWRLCDEAAGRGQHRRGDDDAKVHGVFPRAASAAMESPKKRHATMPKACATDIDATTGNAPPDTTPHTINVNAMRPNTHATRSIRSLGHFARSFSNRCI
jgi:hypothetical protein